MERYVKLEKLGEGAYGKVYKALDTTTNRLVAIKKSNLSLEQEGVPHFVLREIAFLKALDHPNVLKIENVVICSENVFLVTEFFPRDLRDYLNALEAPLPLGTVRRLLAQLLEGTQHIHCNGILHRDLKPQNILLDDSLNLKIADFGLARALSCPSVPYTEHAQTLWYRAPEVLLGYTHYAKAVDLWSIGCIFAELLDSKPLFRSHSNVEQLFSIFKLFGTVSERCWAGVKDCKFYSSQFPQWSARAPEELFPGVDPCALDLLYKLLVCVPESRISPEAALSHAFFWKYR